jgi:long-chain acyl-CoA synthetase
MKNPHHSNALEIVDAAVARAPDAPAIRYFDASLSYRYVDELSDTLAAHLALRGVTRGDRVALYLQNMPHFAIAAIAAWKLGAICVPVNPMNRARELSLIFADCTPKALICLDDLFVDVVSTLPPDLIPPHVLRVSAGEFQTRFDARVLRASRPGSSAQITAFSGLERRSIPAREPLNSTDLALLVYTSGTTGKPKGAMITHGAFSFNANAFCEVAQLEDGDAVLGIAPLFHITGAVCCFGTAIMLAAPLILTYRFDPAVVLDSIDEWQPKFVVAAITAFIAIFNHEAASPQRLACLEKVYSGGAAVPGSLVDQFEARFGHYIHNCYGLTETAAPTHIVPFGVRAPVSGSDGVLSIGRTAPGARARVVEESGETAAAGVPGELVVEGTMVSPGYWKDPAETAANMRADGFRTGDIAFCDRDGWYYIVDRKKDMIISSGYKVWPREVEDVLYTHAAIREAAVVGVADPYRGETVKAFISVRPGAVVTRAEVIEFCRARMAAYKYPRSVEILDELPKTASGKILRRELR